MAGEGKNGIKVEVEGLSILERRLEEAGHELPLVVRAVNRTGSELLAARTLELAPVGDSLTDNHPGLLASTVRAGSSLKVGYVSVGSSATDYTKPVIFGWQRRNIQSNRFPYRALDETREAIVGLYERATEQLVMSTFR